MAYRRIIRQTIKTSGDLVSKRNEKSKAKNKKITITRGGVNTERNFAGHAIKLYDGRSEMTE